MWIMFQEIWAMVGQLQGRNIMEEGLGGAKMLSLWWWGNREGDSAREERAWDQITLPRPTQTQSEMNSTNLLGNQVDTIKLNCHTWLPDYSNICNSHRLNSVGGGFSCPFLWEFVFLCL